MSDGLTIKERIALLKQKDNAGKDSGNSPAGHSTPKVGKLNIPKPVSSAPTATESSPTSPATGGSSIADRIAAMKAKSAAESSPAVNKSPMSASAAKDVAAASRQNFSPPAVAASPPPIATGSTTSSAEVEEPAAPLQEVTPKRASIADRISAMKANSSNESQLPPAIGVKPTPGKIGTKFPIPGSSPPPAVALPEKNSNKDESENAAADKNNSSTNTITPKRMSIADRMAALKSAEKADEDKHKKEDSNESAVGSGANRRLTVDKLAFAQQLKIGGMMHPGGVRPASHVPGHRLPGQAIPGMANTDEGEEAGTTSTRGSIVSLDGSASRRNSASTDGDMRHMSLSRPTIHSVRKSRGLSRLSAEFTDDDGVDIKQLLEQAAGAAETADSNPVTAASAGTLDSVVEDGAEENAVSPTTAKPSQDMKVDEQATAADTAATMEES